MINYFLTPADCLCFPLFSTVYEDLAHEQFVLCCFEENTLLVGQNVVVEHINFEVVDTIA